MRLALSEIGAGFARVFSTWTARSQAAALCVRPGDVSPEILLITNKARSRWGIPKGTVERGETSAAAAVREAFEEAGVLGSVGAQTLGAYRYRKQEGGPVRSVSVHLLTVHRCEDDFPEAGERCQRWVDLEAAAALVASPDLARLLTQVAAELVTS